MKIKSFKIFESNSDVLADIKNVFESILDDHPVHNMVAYEGIEEVLLLKDEISYSRKTNRDRTSTNVIYRYKTDDKKVNSQWGLSKDGFCYMDKDGWHLESTVVNFPISSGALRGLMNLKTLNVIRNEFYAIEFEAKWPQIDLGKFSIDMASCLSQLENMHGLTKHKNGCLYFRNGIETPNEFIEVNWSNSSFSLRSLQDISKKMKIQGNTGIIRVYLKDQS